MSGCVSQQDMYKLAKQKVDICQGKIKKLSEEKENIFLGVSDFEDLATSKIMQKRLADDRTTVQRETTVLANRDTWKRWAEQQFKDYLFVQTNSSSGFIVEPETNNFIKFR